MASQHNLTPTPRRTEAGNPSNASARRPPAPLCSHCYVLEPSQRADSRWNSARQAKVVQRQQPGQPGATPSRSHQSHALATAFSCAGPPWSILPQLHAGLREASKRADGIGDGAGDRHGADVNSRDVSGRADRTGYTSPVAQRHERRRDR